MCSAFRFRQSPVAYIKIAFRVVGYDFRHLPLSGGTLLWVLHAWQCTHTKRQSIIRYSFFRMKPRDGTEFWLSCKAIQLLSSYTNFHLHAPQALETLSCEASVFLLKTTTCCTPHRVSPTDKLWDDRLILSNRKYFYLPLAKGGFWYTHLRAHIHFCEGVRDGGSCGKSDPFIARFFV